MGETETVICYVRNGFELHYGRLPGCPRVPGTPEEVEMHPNAVRYLRKDSRVVFLTPAELEEHKAAIKAKAVDLKERQAAAARDRNKTEPGADRPKRERKPRTRAE